MMSADKIQDPLYFIAIVPPDPIADAVKAVKEDMAVRFSSKAALRSPAHITLHMPFRWPDKKLENLHFVLNNLAESTVPIPIQLNQFGAFVPRVIYVAVEENLLLEQLQKNLLRVSRQQLGIFNGDYKDRAFHPHMTVAFRDLKPRNFKLAWEEYESKPFSFNFTCDAISLLKHDGKEWRVYKSFAMANPTI